MYSADQLKVYWTESNAYLQFRGIERNEYSVSTSKRMKNKYNKLRLENGDQKNWLNENSALFKEGIFAAEQKCKAKKHAQCGAPQAT